jgi:hypothetical protein
MRAVGKRREVGRELFRKHRKDFGGGINRGGVGRRVAIDSRSVNIECPAEEQNNCTKLLEKAMPQWMNSLRATLERRTEGNLFGPLQGRPTL